MSAEGLGNHRNRWKFHALLLVVSLAALLGVRVVAARRSEIIARDGAIYLTYARRLADTPAEKLVTQYDYPPGYPLKVLHAARAVGATWPDGWIAAARGVSILHSMIALLCVYLLGSLIFDRTAGLTAMLLVGLHGEFVEKSVEVASDVSAAGLAMLSVVLAIWARQMLSGQVRRARGLAGALSPLLAFGAGLNAGMAYLVRPEGLIGAMLGLVLVAGIWGLPRRWRLLQAVCVVALIAGTLSAALPYAQAIGGLTSKKEATDFVSAGAALPLAQVGSVSDLWRGIRRTLDRLRSIGGDATAVFVLLAAATWVGMYLLRLRLPEAVRQAARPRRPVGWLLMLGGLAILGPLVVSLEMQRGRPDEAYISSRHLMIPALLLAPAAGAGAAVMARWTLQLAGRLGWPRKPALARAGWALAAVIAAGVTAFPVSHEGKGVYRRAGEELAGRLRPREVVLAPYAWVPFYAGSPPERFANTGPDYYGTGPSQLTPESIAQRFRLAMVPSGVVVFSDDVASRAEGRSASEVVSDFASDPRCEAILVYPPKGQPAGVRLWAFRVNILPAEDAGDGPQG